jgi:hypothetical protein
VLIGWFFTGFLFGCFFCSKKLLLSCECHQAFQPRHNYLLALHANNLTPSQASEQVEQGRNELDMVLPGARAVFIHVYLGNFYAT